MISVPAAEALAERAHGDDRSDAGVLVIDHVRSVAARMRSDPDVYDVPASLSHDTVESPARRSMTCALPGPTTD